MCYAIFGDTHITDPGSRADRAGGARGDRRGPRQTCLLFCAAHHRRRRGDDWSRPATPSISATAPSATATSISSASDCIFISTRLMQDRFALAFEFFINVGHHFVEAVGVPQSFCRPGLVAGPGRGARRNQSGRIGKPPPALTAISDRSPAATHDDRARPQADHARSAKSVA